MSVEQTSTEQQQAPMSRERYKELQIEAQKEIREEIKFLKTEEEYQKLMADIEEHKARRLHAIAQQYQYTRPSTPTPVAREDKEDYNHESPQSEPFLKEVPETIGDKKERKLKAE